MTTMSYRRDSTVWEERQVGQHRGSSYAWFVQPSSRTASPLDGSFSFFLKLLGSPSYNLGVSCITLKYLPCVSKCILQGVYLACLTRSLSTCLLPLVATIFSSACLSRLKFSADWLKFSQAMGCLLHFQSQLVQVQGSSLPCPAQATNGSPVTPSVI